MEYQQWFQEIISTAKLQPPTFAPFLEDIIKYKNKYYPENRLPLHIDDFADYIMEHNVIMQLLYVLFAQDMEQKIFNNKKFNEYPKLNCVSNKDGSYILHIVTGFAKQSHTIILQEIIKRSSDLNVKDKDGWTPLIYASARSNTTSNLATVKILLDAKCDVNCQDKYGWSPLMYATRSSNSRSTIETVKLLLAYNSNPNLQNKEGWTALMLSAYNTHQESTLETVQLLLDAKSDINLKNNLGQTALMVTVTQENSMHKFATIKLLNDARIKQLNRFPAKLLHLI